MTDGDALRRAIVADPDDDTPRLIYADWLDENNQPDRAALIRHQIEAERAEPYSPEARAAERRADELVAANGGAWGKHVRAKVVREDYVRGFIGRVVIDVGRFPEVAPPLFAAEPVQSVELIRFSPNSGQVSMTAVFGVAEMGRVRDLALPSGMDGVTEAEFDALADSPRLANVANLSLDGNRVMPAWLLKLLSGRALPNLTGLGVSDIANLGPGLATAAQQARHRRFKRLVLNGVAFEVLSLQRLLASACLSQLEEFTIRPPEGGLNTMSHLDLGWTLPWDTLRKLDLGGQWLGPNAVSEFARLPECKGLRWLGLAGNRLKSAGVRVLVESPHLNLNYLDVSDNGLDADDVAELRERFPKALVVSE
ncbi:MAG TPA: TIGR02996 domain-containing protein [Gemmataceae bacterium]|nr:TIGR02996 domain-containing protein [Gemmataceae bacterium]